MRYNIDTKKSYRQKKSYVLWYFIPASTLGRGWWQSHLLYNVVVVSCRGSIALIRMWFFFIQVTMEKIWLFLGKWWRVEGKKTSCCSSAESAEAVFGCIVVNDRFILHSLGSSSMVTCCYLLLLLVFLLRYWWVVRQPVVEVVDLPMGPTRWMVVASGRWFCSDVLTVLYNHRVLDNDIFFQCMDRIKETLTVLFGIQFRIRVWHCWWRWLFR